MFERFTDGARAVVVNALERARGEDAVTATMRHGPWLVSGSHRVDEVGGDAGDTNRALLQRASSPACEQGGSRPEHDGCEVDPELVGQGAVNALTNHIAAAHHEDVLVSGGGAGLVDGGLQPVGHEREGQVKPDVARPGVRDDEEGRRGGEACPVGPFIIPAVRPVHEVEKAAAHHHCAGCLYRLPEHSGVHVVAAVHRPGVQSVAAVYQSVFEIGPRSGYEPIERHRYVRDNVGHPASSLERDMQTIAASGTHRRWVQFPEVSWATGEVELAQGPGSGGQGPGVWW